MKKIKSLLLIASASLAFVASARAEINPVNWRPLTNMAALTITNAETRLITNSVIELRKNTGLAFMPYFRATNPATANVTWKLYVGNDKTNWTTVSEDYARALNGTNWVRGYKWWSADVLGGVRYAYFGAIVNGHSNSISISNGIVSQFN